MFIRKQIGLVFAACALFAVASFAQGAPPAAGAKAPSSGPKAASKPLNINPFFNSVDTNHDGCLSKKEWLAAGLVENTFEVVSKGAKCITREAMAKSNPPAVLDENHDGILTLAEVKDFLKKGLSPNQVNAKKGPPPAKPATKK